MIISLQINVLYKQIDNDMFVAKKMYHADQNFSKLTKKWQKSQMNYLSP